MSSFASSSPSRDPSYGKTKHPKSRKPHWSDNRTGPSKVYPSLYQTDINPTFNRPIQRVSHLIFPHSSTMRATILTRTTVLAPIVTIHSSLIVLVLHHPTSTIPISGAKEARADNSYPGPHRQHQSTHTIRYLALQHLDLSMTIPSINF
jgi:hypothetical protein